MFVNTEDTLDLNVLFLPHTNSIRELFIRGESYCNNDDT